MATLTNTDTRGGPVDTRAVASKAVLVALAVAAGWAFATILIPFALALVLAIALSPVADRLERWGLPRVASCLVCMLAVAAMLVVAVGLLTYQAGTILADADRYLERFGTMVDRGIQATGLDHHSDGGGAQTQAQHQTGGEAARSRQGGPTGDAPQGRGARLVRQFVGGLGRWLATGVGGVLGVIGGAVVFLAFLFYMLHGRDGWIDSLTDAFRRLGLRPSRSQFEKVREQTVRYVGVLALVATGYMIVVSLALKLIGVPQPLLWGMLAGLFETVPYFGPLVSSVLPTLVAATLGHPWQPMATAGLFLVLHTIEGYVITPLLYGRAIRFDPVTILFNALFFGALWGPAGLAVATPMLIVLRGLLLITPDTPALDALADVRDEKAGTNAPATAALDGG